jgi:hypothetical protein
MKFTTSAIAAYVVGVALGHRFTRVDLPAPLDWTAGPSLFPGRIIAGYNAGVKEYTAESWGAHVLSQCTQFSSCTSALAFQGTVPGPQLSVYLTNKKCS